MSFYNQIKLIALTFIAIVLFGQGCGQYKSSDSFATGESNLDNVPMNIDNGYLKAADFVGTGANFSLISDDSLFDFDNSTGVLMISSASNLDNIHSHYTDGTDFGDYTYSGSMMVSDNSSGVGVTFLSGYPKEDSYYRLSVDGNSQSFHLSARNSTACQSANSGLTVQAGEWYSFKIMVKADSTKTSVLAKVWPAYTREPFDVQMSCVDIDSSRKVKGTVGLWASGSGEKKWSDLFIGFDPYLPPVTNPTTPPSPTPQDCGSLAHGQSESRTRYQAQSVAFGSTCVSEVQMRTCNDGVLSTYLPNNYQYDTCTVDQAPMPTPTPTPPPAPSNGILVANISDLNAALAKAKGGETIVLKSGSYGMLRINGIKPASKVTITSENNKNLSQISQLRVENSENIEFNGLKVRGPGNTVYFLNNNRFLTLKNSDISGNSQMNRSNPSNTDLDTGFTVKIEKNSTDIIVENNYIHDASTAALMLWDAHNSIVRNNFCDWIAADCFKIENTNGVLFDGNHAGQNWHTGAGAHADFLQARGTNNGTYINNLAIQNGSQFQGLFFGGTTPQNNNLIENNLIASGSGRGISVRGTGNIIRYNTVIRRMPKSYDYPVQIYGPDSEGNIISAKAGQGGLQPNGTSYNVQWDNPSSPYHYSKFYKNAMNTGVLTIYDFKPVPGSPAEKIGAYKLINKLINHP